MATTLQDDFSELDGTELNGKALDVGGTWTVEGGNGAWAVQTGKAQGSASSSIANDTAYADAGQADQVLSGTVEMPASPQDAYYGLCGRLSDGSNFWLIAVYAQGDTFVIIENNANSFTVRASVGVTISASTTYTLRATFNGTTITATVDGGNEISYGSATFNQTSTKFGLRSGNDGRFDSFLVEDLAAAATVRMRTLMGVGI